MRDVASGTRGCPPYMQCGYCGCVSPPVCGVSYRTFCRGHMHANSYRSVPSLGCLVCITRMDCLSLLLLAVLAAEASRIPCRHHCDPETGLRKEELLPTPCPYKTLSQCNNPSSCDDSTPGTGHKLFGALTEDLVAVERCYSFCYTNVRKTIKVWLKCRVFLRIGCM